jgi:RimJ/RimL family protein N-acetyltransferase
MDRLPTYAALGAARFNAALPSVQTAPADHAWQLADGVTITIRAARPDDGPLMQALVRGLSANSSYQRFFYPLHELPPATLARFSHADPLHEMTLLAVTQQDGREVAVGMAQYAADWPHTTCEFALLVADAWQRKGIAARLLRNLVGVARAAGLERIEGEILADNLGMRHLLAKLGFAIGPHPDGGYLRKTWRDLDTSDPALAPQAMLAARVGAQAQTVRR